MPSQSYPSHELIHISHYWLGSYEYLMIIDGGIPYVIAYSVGRGRCGVLCPHAMPINVHDDFILTLSQLVSTGRVKRPIIWCSQEAGDPASEPVARNAALFDALAPLTSRMFRSGTIDEIDGDLYAAAIEFACEHARARERGNCTPAPEKHRTVDLSYKYAAVAAI